MSTKDLIEHRAKAARESTLRISEVMARIDTASKNLGAPIPGLANARIELEEVMAFIDYVNRKETE